MQINKIIKDELDRIKAVAKLHAALCLKNQYNIIKAHELSGRLSSLVAIDFYPSIVYQKWPDRAEINFFSEESGAKTVSAIAAAAIPILRVERGYNDDTTRITLAGYEGVEVFVSASALDWRSAA